MQRQSGRYTVGHPLELCVTLNCALWRHKAAAKTGFEHGSSPSWIESKSVKATQPRRGPTTPQRPARCCVVRGDRRSTSRQSCEDQPTGVRCRRATCTVKVCQEGSAAPRKSVGPERTSRRASTFGRHDATRGTLVRL